MLGISLEAIKAALSWPSKTRTQTPAQEVEPDFSQVISQALAKIRANVSEETRRTLLNEIIALESDDLPLNVTKPGVLAETLNEVHFTPGIENMLEDPEASNF
jgi:hypothetical protein